MNEMTIREIEQLLFHEKSSISEKRLRQLESDERKGVQIAVHKYRKQQEKELALIEKYDNLQEYERSLYRKGIQYIAGIDEVGRGPLAGPVIAAAVILPANVKLIGIDDSKKITSEKREYFYHQILEQSISVGVGIISAQDIDEINIYQASILAMKIAIGKLSVTPEHLLVDALALPIDIPQTSIIKGDGKSVSIAAGSIVAKVTRDRLMKNLDKTYPQYGFARNMGYGTKEHLNALEEYGPIGEHRRSFAPVQSCVFDKALG
jgi:ribonuclease HII